VSYQDEQHNDDYGQTAVTDPPAPAAEKSIKAQFADWPQKNDERKQPWDLSHTSPSDRDELVNNPGTPNTVAPIVIGHSFPILTSGSGGDQAWAVRELGARLKTLGYETDIATGNNPYASLTSSVMSAVERFREDYNVEEDPSAFGGNNAASRARAANHVGPWTWEAIIRASDQARTAAAA
jgi:hypothetical protein